MVRIRMNMMRSLNPRVKEIPYEKIAELAEILGQVRCGNGSITTIQSDAQVRGNYMHSSVRKTANANRGPAFPSSDPRQKQRKIEKLPRHALCR